MGVIERVAIDVLLQLMSAETLNNFLKEPENVAILIGALISISGALLGTFLLLRGVSLASDAISHTVLLGIVVTFLVMTAGLGLEADLNSPWLLIGAAASGLLTVWLTEFISRSGLVREDAALGLAFPLLFAISVILVSRYVDQAHLDTDSVIIGEIGMAWANTSNHCLENCESITITPEHPRAIMKNDCINCVGGISPRDPEAEFTQSCANCGTYTAAAAWQNRLIDAPPQQVFWPHALTTTGLLALVNLLFVAVLYKELKLSTFDPALAAALGFRPGLLHYALMALVSLTAVGAFDAVGSVLVVAFFIIPPATAYLLTDRLFFIMLLSPVLGVVSAVTGYELAQGNFLWILEIETILKGIDRLINLEGYTQWNTSISACMVLMMFVFFCGAWAFSPRYGLAATLLRRLVQQQRFAVYLLLGHIAHHEGRPESAEELAVNTLSDHLHWPENKTTQALAQARLRGWAEVVGDEIALTDEGRHQITRFRRENLPLDPAT